MHINGKSIFLLEHFGSLIGASPGNFYLAGNFCPFSVARFGLTRLHVTSK